MNFQEFQKPRFLKKRGVQLAMQSNLKEFSRISKTEILEILDKGRSNNNSRISKTEILENDTVLMPVQRTDMDDVTDVRIVILTSQNTYASGGRRACDPKSAPAKFWTRKILEFEASTEATHLIVDTPTPSPVDTSVASVVSAMATEGRGNQSDGRSGKKEMNFCDRALLWLPSVCFH